MNKIITISRLYANGGRTIGKMVVEELQIPIKKCAELIINAVK